MNLILHQLKTDVQHFRWRLAVLWLLFIVEAVLAEIHALTGTGIGLTHFLLELGQTFLALTLVASLVLADPLVGTGAGWLTRPVRRAHLFWAKSAFIIIWIFVPWLVVLVFSSAMRGYSPHLALAQVEESLLCAVPFVLVVAVLAALTRNPARFYLAVGITIGGIFAGSVLVEMLVRAHVLLESHLGGWQETGRVKSSTVIAWSTLAAGALCAWILQAHRGSWWPAVCWLAAGMFAFPFIMTAWQANFLTPRLIPSAPVSLSLLATNDPVVSEPQHQLLSTEMAVAGVPAGQLAVLQDLTAQIQFKGEHHTTPLPRGPYIDYRRRTRPADSSQQNDYLNIIAGFFPADTIWFNYNGFSGDVASAFGSESLYKRFPKGPPPGNLDGSVTVDLYQVKEVAVQPLRPATFQALPGLKVSIQKIRLADGVITLSLDECSAQLMLDRDVDTAEPDNFNQPLCTYFLYDPKSGEAFALGNRNTHEYFPPFLSGESHLSLELIFPYPALRERLAGVTAADWLREVRLCVFAPVYAGTSQLPFHRDNYQWTRNYDGDVRRQKENLNDAQAINQAMLPADATDAQREAYLDEILLNVPNYWNNTLFKTIGQKLQALGTNGPPALLRRLPLSENLEYSLIFPAIDHLITRDQLPELLAALQRDNDVVQIFIDKKWEADARPLLVAKLPDHREPMPADALRVAAEAQDPATYADLRWHFAHLNNGHERVFAALEKCPGFDTAAAVREAWQNARLKVIADPGELSAIAARQGLPDALNFAIVHAEDAVDPQQHDRELAQLATLTGYDGPANHTLPWLTANLAQLHYDATQQRYTLDSAH